jgi:hypothetical protein
MPAEATAAASPGPPVPTFARVLLLCVARGVAALVVLAKPGGGCVEMTLVTRQERDTCFCEDEVGANLVYFWLTDWAASIIKVLAVPVLHRSYHQLNQSHRIRLGGKWISVWRPSFVTPPPTHPPPPYPPPLASMSLLPAPGCSAGNDKHKRARTHTRTHTHTHMAYGRRSPCGS